MNYQKFKFESITDFQGLGFSLSKTTRPVLSKSANIMHEKSVIVSDIHIHIRGCFEYVIRLK